MVPEEERYKILVKGLVQGVGFRPFVYRLARAYHLTGWVANSPEGVVIEAQGKGGPLQEFITALRSGPPPLAVVSEVSVTRESLRQESPFTICRSGVTGEIATLIAPDIGICPDCLAEFHDPDDRRHHYPFINCTNCGPRYTIVNTIPYDRANTTMQQFTMCEACRNEYDDPADRRFHAQPNACPGCGPTLEFVGPDGGRLAERDGAVVESLRMLQAGKIIAVKGLGGFHLAVNARNPEAVKGLRQRKGRDAKPFAVMVRDLETARTICRLTAGEQSALTSPRKPIVLCGKQEQPGLADEIAPGHEMFGLMLPYTPLHHLLFSADLDALVMTSGNFSEEPLCARNEEALQRLRGIADFFLFHNREISQRCDDSVVCEMSGNLRVLRRSRGYSPAPLFLKDQGSMILGVGGELKNTICLLQGKQAFLSQHLGDLKNLEEYNFFRSAVAHLEKIFKIAPELVVHDLHPGYLSTRWALEHQGLPTHAVQHHHAHLAACLAENRLDGPAIGIILDGTGYGTDRSIWGGEVLLGGQDGCERFASLETMPLPGGDAAIKAPWRTAVAYLHTVFGNELPDLPFLARYPENDLALVREMVDKKVNTPMTSSCGRLFDAIAAMGGGVQEIRYEAEAAIDLMQQTGGNLGTPFDFEMREEDGLVRMSVRSLVRSAVDAILGGASLSEVSRRFHATLILLFTEAARQARQQTGIRQVVLSGGVFQNRILFEGLVESLARKGFEVVTHCLVPPNDGCVSLGQAVIGRRFLQRG
jgi:hydrogenase maturation protein HypF